MDKDTILSTIRERMDEKGITVKDMATSLNVTEKAVYCWFNGVARPSLDRMVEIADLVGYTIELRDKAEVEYKLAKHVDPKVKSSMVTVLSYLLKQLEEEES